MARFSILFTFITVFCVRSGNSEKYLGCYIDNTGRRELLTKFNINDGTVTPEVCIRFCRTRSYPVAGAQFRNQCYCGFNVTDGILVPENECYFKCVSNNTVRCGGDLRLSVYETGFKDKTKGKYLGCYAEFSSTTYLMRGAREKFPGRLTNKICLHFCRSMGYDYSGTRSRSECFCSIDRPLYKYIAEEEDCDQTCSGSNQEICGGNLRLSVYGIIKGKDFNPVASLYEGCYPGNVLGNAPWKSTNLLTVQYCVGYCYKHRRRFAGIRHGNKCYCDDAIDNIPSAAEEECDTPCRGDDNQTCGGQRHMSVYYTGIPDKTVAPEFYYKGCYSGDKGWLLYGPLVKLDAITPQNCAKSCFDMSYRFAGIEKRTDCHCVEDVTEDAKTGFVCHDICSGYPTENCGAQRKLSVYDTGLQVYERTMRKLCEVSVSLANGKKACKGSAIFYEDFDTSSMTNWTHVIQMPNAPDYPFVVYDKNTSNVFVADGILVIKPSLMAEEKVEGGKIKLKDCTGMLNTEECSREAMAYRILPPIESAMVTTKESFSFLYGQIDIRAKLPRGDWLVPALWLEPKRATYGPYYNSGRIVLALARGNDNLNCNGTNRGNTWLEAGLAAGSNEKPIRRYLTWESSKRWSNSFHTYTFKWTPGNFSFFVDGGREQTLVKKGQTIRDLFGATNAGSWPSGSPFDTEFYISVGLYAGGMHDFNDDCNSEGREKPWTNFGVKAMANFWQARKSWSTTWQDYSTLRIDSIKVTAL